MSTTPRTDRRTSTAIRASWRATDIGAFEDGHPRTTTEAATNITETGATLRGSVDPLGFATTYYFDWGPTTAYGNRIPATAVSAGSGSGAQAVAQDLGGISAPEARSITDWW